MEKRKKKRLHEGGGIIIRPVGMEIILTLIDVEAGHSNSMEQCEQRRHVAVMKDMCVLVHSEGGGLWESYER